MGPVEINELSRAMRQIVWQFGPKGLDGECCENLSMPEFLALEKVAETRDCPVQDVGLQLGFTKSGATRIVNRMEKKGYVQKIKSHEDGRICCVVITESGEKVLRSAEETYSRKIEQLFSMMPKESSPQIKEMLVAMSRLLGR